jgi:hypothetical protein
MEFPLKACATVFKGTIGLKKLLIGNNISPSLEKKPCLKNCPVLPENSQLSIRGREAVANFESKFTGLFERGYTVNPVLLF